MSMATAEQRGFTPPSRADLTSVESNNPLIRSYLALKPGIDRIAGFRNRVTATLADTFSQPLTLPSSPLRNYEYPSEYDKKAAKEAALQPENTLIKNMTRWAAKFALPGTTLFAAACAMAPQEVNRPTFVEPAKTEPPRPTATVTAAPGIGAAIPTFEAGNPDAKIVNPIIDRINRGENVSQEDLNKVSLAKGAEAQAQATVMAKEAQKSPTPVKKETPEDSCSFMGIKCSKADLLKKNVDGTDYYYVGLNFPEGTEIPFPIDGQLSFIELSPDAPFKGASVKITNTGQSLASPAFSFYGSLEKTATPLGVNLPKGTPGIKTSKNEERKNYGYDVVFLASRQNPVTKKPESLLDIYKAAIPNLSDKFIEVKSQGSTAYYAGDIFFNSDSQ